VSHDAVQTVLERTVSDEAFRSRLFTRPDEALAEYELSPTERAALRSLCVDAGDSQTAALDERQTKSAVPPFWLTGGF
jgi:hypothetical protein